MYPNSRIASKTLSIASRCQNSLIPSTSAAVQPCILTKSTNGHSPITKRWLTTDSQEPPINSFGQSVKSTKWRKYSHTAGKAPKPLAQLSSSEPKPWPKDKIRVSAETIEALTIKPYQFTTMTPTQEKVVKLMPGLAKPYVEGTSNSSRSDVYIHSDAGSGSTAAYLVPAIDARAEALAVHGQKAVESAGLMTDEVIADRARRICGRSRVGVLILSHSREAATQIALQATRMTAKHAGFEVRLLVGGVSQDTQIRDWRDGRKDIVVATPGRLRELIHHFPEMVEELMYTQNLVIDETSSLLEMGYRDDIEDIQSYLPKSPELQTILVTHQETFAVEQARERWLSANHAVVNTATDKNGRFKHIEQWHSILPSASTLILHLTRLIAHERLLHPEGKIILTLQTPRMVQLFEKILSQLLPLLPGGEPMRLVSTHIDMMPASRAAVEADFIKSPKPAILLTSEGGIQANYVNGITRLIQVGIPPSTGYYYKRLRKLQRKEARSDLVLLPWEIGYLTWRLMENEIRPITLTELKAEVADLARNPESALEPLYQAVEGSKKSLNNEEIKETFASLLGYYIPKNHEVRVKRPVIIQGLKDWTTQACGLVSPPFISDAFISNLGAEDGRTRKFGLAPKGEVQGGHGKAKGRPLLETSQKSLDKAQYMLHTEDPEDYKFRFYRPARKVSVDEDPSFPKKNGWKVFAAALRPPESGV